MGTRSGGGSLWATQHAAPTGHSVVTVGATPDVVYGLGRIGCAAGFSGAGAAGCARLSGPINAPRTVPAMPKPVVPDLDRWTTMEAGLHTWQRAHPEAIWVEIDTELDLHQCPARRSAREGGDRYSQRRRAKPRLWWAAGAARKPHPHGRHRWRSDGAADPVLSDPSGQWGRAFPLSIGDSGCAPRCPSPPG